MTFKNFADVVDEKLALVVPVINSIEQGGGYSDLRDLGQHLVDAMNLFHRNPGIEAAADDLYAAAAALVSDSTAHSQPIVRKLRLFRETHRRFNQRLAAAAERMREQETRAEHPFRRVA